MIPAWSLGVLLLGYVFGFPVPFNSTQRQYEYETLLQLNDTVGNTTQPFMSNDTESNETEIPFPFQDYNHAIPPEELMQSQNETDSNSTLTTYRFNSPPSHINKLERKLPLALAVCGVSLCVLNNLGHALNRGGDESAGGATRDPHGNGKR
ncbi:uncharacterized protein zgc:193726 isoform X2 [Salmo salar]|uniref:Uncharacterized protein zgc:193726 isoform X2 n=1 Tax=Salmo salar TaxID=8030 RepID=A0A1S3MYK4_SALSA|nr:uncharacterized protein zgc:193726 isoform X2 [Salmo salar]|eukprot:XP_014008323.1 PREDICTED: uncharacterized protein LOC106576030 isoform X2 [Salmo salar]